MYFDHRFVKAQTDYKREQLKKSYPKNSRRTVVEKGNTVVDGNPLWPGLWARLSLLNR